MRETHFSDAEEACAAFRATRIEFIPSARSCARWCLGAAELGRVSLWWGRLGAHGAGLGMMPPGLALLAVAGEEARGWTINRHSLAPRRVALLPQGVEYACALPVAASWFALSLPAAWLDSHGLGAAGARRTVATFEAGDGAARIRRAFSAARRRAMRDAALLDDPHARRAMQRTLLDAMLDALGTDPQRALRDHRLLGKLLAYLHAHRGHPLWTADLCAALATTPRSLRRIFAEAFGMTPGEYLRMRRLRLARKAIVSGEYASVTSAAVHFGFFDLGRFAASYRRWFGEMPSAALRRTREDARLG